MNTARENAYAKLNLTLQITGKDGEYHALDSLVCTLDLSDRVIVTRRKDSLVGVKMHGMGSETIPPETNNAQRAGEAFVSSFGTKGAEITVYKNIPMGGGLGGSSADAAAVLRAMAKLYSVTDNAALKALADSLGSDTGYLLQGGFCRMTGRGNEVESLGACPTFYALLICPEEGVSTPKCYARYDELTEGKTGAHADTAATLALLKEGRQAEFFRSLKNDLYEAACSLNGDVKKAVEEAQSFSPLAAGMSGSGSTAFALFETRELAEWAKSRYRGKFRTVIAKTADPQDNQTKKLWRNPFVLFEDEGENE